MVRANCTDVLYILDVSGSMSPLRSQLITSFNIFINDQRDLDGDMFISLVTYSNMIDWIYTRESIKKVTKLGEDSCVCNGMTAMCDAIGSSIDKLGRIYANMDESERPSSVLVFIFTDGEDNASTDYTPSAIKTMVQHQTEVYSWEFNFISQGLDDMRAHGIATGIGIPAAAIMSGPATDDAIISAITSCATRVTQVRTQPIYP